MLSGHCTRFVLFRSRRIAMSGGLGWKLTNITPEMKVYREETFGPVAPIITVKDVEEAIAVANDSEYGLSAGGHHQG